MQRKAEEVALAITSHNQNTNRNNANANCKQQQTAPHLFQNTAPKTTTQRTNPKQNQPTQRRTIDCTKHNSVAY
jgi:hypothetical protein